MSTDNSSVASTMQDSPLSLTALFRHGEEVHGRAEVVYDDGRTTHRSTFSEVANRARRLAGSLRALGVRPGDRVATFMWNTQAHLEAYLAVPCLGAVLHTINVRLRPDEVAYLANHAEDSMVLVDEDLWDAFAAALPSLTTVRQVVVATRSPDEMPPGTLSFADLIESGAPADFADLEERTAAAMCYTSGTTGRPKGVVYSHRSMYLHSMANCMASGFALSDADRVLQMVPMFHANGWGFPHAAWMAGSAIILPDRFLGAERVAGLIEAERPTVSGGVPTVWRDLLDYADGHAADLSSLRVISCAGSAVPPTLIRRYVERGIELVQAWGMTETSPLAAIARPPGNDLTHEWHWRSRTGRILPGVQVRVVDEDGMVLPRDGVSNGELQVRGPWVTGHYFRELDAGRFCDGWLRTGDVGSLDDYGFLKITDRAKDLIKSGGEWISSLQIEDALNAHDDVQDVAVIGVPDPRWEERPLAVVVRRSDRTVTAAELRAWLTLSMARWQLPERWAFVATVPKTSVGKADKRALRASYDAGELSCEFIGDLAQ